MDKVCIVTVYDGINSGSFWQAYALGKAIENMGYPVCYLKRVKQIRTTFSLKSLFVDFMDYLALKGIRRVVYCCFRYGLKQAVYHIRCINKFKKERKVFKVIKAKSNESNNVICYVLGSDTIWNLDSKFFLRDYKMFFGEYFTKSNVITYAGSVANTSLEKCKQLPGVKKCINNWSYIGVRDVHTHEVISSFTDKKINIVCDPTLLYDKEFYEQLVCEEVAERYIFLYLFEDLSAEQIKELELFAKRKNLSIIQGTTERKYNGSEKCIINSPYTFIKYMLSADYVVTDTFHGTLFSCNLKKNFVVIDREKKKVEDFLKRVDFEDRVIGKGDSIITAFNKEIDYNNRLNKLNKWRENSLRYLEMALNKK